MRRNRLLAALCACSLLTGTLTSCIVAKIEVREVPKSPGTAVRTPMKAHLLDGSAIVFRNGAVITNDSIRGRGQRYDFALWPLGDVEGVHLDSVVAVENYARVVDTATSVVFSVLGTAAAVAGGAALAVAIFGSCPTYYTVEDTGERLQAEGFSYSIASILESRDVDLLNTRISGRSFQLQIRNEALETHYLNHVELLVVDHDPSLRAVPDRQGQPVMVAAARPAVRAVARGGHDVTSDLAAADGAVMATAAATLRVASPANLHDYIDFEFEPLDADSAALVFHVRNSLLSTVLLYDVMLRGAGPLAVDWLGEQLELIGPASALGKWYARSMGLHVAVPEGDGWRETARVPDVGPIAWKDLVVMIPITRGAPVRARVTFPMDGWRIDAVALGTATRAPSVHVAPIATISVAGARGDSAQHSLAAPDDNYLITSPGQQFTVTFELPEPTHGLQRSLLIASQGYYTEWIRRDWLRTESPKFFEPGDAALFDALQRWLSRREEFERQFYSSKIAVR